ncbi:DUF4130 domain-containing protein [Methanocella arvoryzae]|uniref:DUF4130 domain-containing protein n=1 Tax=Methanocella arvoryzae (strain DSM 22066 / NBRC 105507 / MRE50) TaxID=351160 RepID=Q0W0K0_METAR|nr:DUF4130 domain-containing protein [Methanocella arvoryzae]CAJ38093.1 conserved hypothetical protein [Methanocella arvoryzae MRE50]
MIIGYKKNVWDVLRAAIAMNREPGATFVCGKDQRDLDQKLAQYHGEIIEKVEVMVPQVPVSVKLKLRERLPCTGSRCQPSLHTYITYSLKHRKCVPNELVRMLAGYYPDIGQALGHKDELSKKYYSLEMDVMREIERLRAMTRPRPAGNLMYVEIAPEHYVIDLYLEWLGKRVTDRASVVKCHRDYYLVNAHFLGYDGQYKEISPEEASRILGNVPDADISVWEAFYDSQAIESRRNREYASAKIPAKCASLSHEIKIERKKIERGIPRNSLDDFFSLQT